ncbi:MAG TPA: polysaccharide biosynthesis protein, partial [Gordonia sp. (in: high G+C Gram-positive bacteria)]|nr:polysaccharide biosynthesis protein [Gordonia sp. (in: high G+C Gram-positive bacteria)]
MGRVTGATIVAAASGYLVLVLAARDLGATGYGVFAVFWAAYGMVTGTQNGQLQ